MPNNFTFAVDLPNPYDLEGAWINVDYFDTREEAIAYAKKIFGADAQGRIGVVSELPE